MDINWPELLVGWLGGLVAGAVFQEPINDGWRRFTRFMTSDRFEKKDAEFFQLGSRDTNVLIIDGNGSMEYKKNSLSMTVVATPTMPEDVRARRALVEDEHARLADAKLNAAWNGKLYALASYSTSRADNERALALNLNVYETDYLHFLATVGELGKESVEAPPPGGMRRTYFPSGVTPSVNPALAVGLGIVTLVRSSDNYLVFSRRSKDTAVRPGEVDVSVAEGISPDFDRSGAAVDPFRAAARGIEEEIGIPFAPDAIHILGLAVDEQFYQWTLVAFAESTLTVDQMKAAKSTGASGMWESERLVAVKNTIPEVFGFLTSNKAWGFAWLCAYWALVRTHSKREVDAYVKRHM
ncbi:MAG: hypothetical protein K2X34_11285 [Hyphomonadaceae bacterium]|nr:hypothetical protein [Hyphomonadaceae bacterium]